jgi:uncharacterized iron-regulated protein
MRIYIIALGLASLSCVAALSCGTPPAASTTHAAAPTKTERAWKTSIASSHPLAGAFYKHVAGATGDAAWQPVTESDVADAAANAAFVLIGEKHDNPDHHVEQARIVGALVDRKKRPAIVFEMLETDMKDKLDAYMERADASSAGFGDAMSWEKRGWGEWENYKPIADVIFADKLAIVPGGIPTARAIDIAHHGEAALSAEDQKTYLLDVTMDPNLESSLHDELVKAHCGHLPSTMVRGMLLAERARDAGLALAMLPYARTGAVLIAGNGHVRNDRGVPWTLAQLHAQGDVVSIALEEVQDDVRSPGGYDIHADFAFFTPRASDEDPCVKFREQMRKRRTE